MILGPDKKRLSKRHGATSVEDFQKLGILPNALFNYLSLLGWSPGGAAEEVMSRQQIVKKFSLKKVNSSPAAFDYEKLNHINAEHLKRLPLEKKASLAGEVLKEHGWVLDPDWRVLGAKDTETYLRRILKVLGNRFSSLLRLPEQLGFFFAEDFPVDTEAAREHLSDPAGQHHLAQLADTLAAGIETSEPVPAAKFEEMVRVTAQKLNVGAGELIHPCRVALTGQTRSAGIFEVMELIGLPRVLARLRRVSAQGVQS
jgi:glutamyl-tRNA synthetase